MRRTLQGFQPIFQLQQIAKRKFQHVFVGVVDRPNGKILERCPRLLNMITQDVRHRLALEEPDQPLRTRLVRSKISNIQTPRIEVVAREQYACFAVIERNRIPVVPRNRHNAHYPPAQIHLPYPTRPRVDAEFLRGLLYGRCNKLYLDRRITHRLHRRIAPDVVVMRVGVRHDQSDIAQMIPLQPPVHHQTQLGDEVAVARPSVPQ